MGTHNPDMQKGLESEFDCFIFDWMEFWSPSYVQEANHLPHLAHLSKPPSASYPVNDINQRILTAFSNFNPDIVFMHIQSGDVVTPETARIMAQTSMVFNWTGDVRFPVPNFYFEIGKHITSTLFTNMNDVDVCMSNGVKADYLQVGFDSVHFNPLGVSDNKYPEIIFLGSNYQHCPFPLTQLRCDMVTTLKSRYGNRFGVYGGGWSGMESGNITSYDEEGMAYRSCKIAINLSHFAYRRYSSDRMYRILGSGAFCLSHHYPEIELDFKNGEDLVVWNDVNDLINKIDKYLTKDNERGRIALNGCLKARTEFTWHHFAKNLKKITEKNKIKEYV